VLYGLAALHSPHAWIHGGDVLDHPGDLAEWYTSLIQPLASRGPVFVARGNHDTLRIPSSEEEHQTSLSGLCSIFGDENVTAYTSISLGGSRIRLVVLDTDDDSEVQMQWLQKEMSSREFRDADFRVVVAHIPPGGVEWWDPEAWHNGESEWYAMGRAPGVIMPPLMAAKVDLILSGHSHLYQRGQFNDTHVVIAGGGTPSLETHQVQDLGVYHTTVLKQHYGILKVHERCRLEWSAYDLQDAFIDRVSITRCLNID